MQRLVEMPGFEEVGDAVEGIIVDEDGAEQRLLGLDIVWCLAIKRCFRHAELARCLSHDVPEFRSRILDIRTDKSRC
ncbi:hypothetical protein [Mesorhizobium amorphae]|uniref:hypothetical protein n=1 Tax=Mesorhizobium amorphae TaxID=71433 RepID=UPI001FCCB388|nr:hypothetical protein [Mesorhizobium amorphae]